MAKETRAEIVGIGLDPISEKCFANKINEIIVDKRFDISDLDKLEEVVKKYKPDFVFI